MNIYGYTFRVACPNNSDESVEYTLLIKSDDMIMVEDIVDFCNFIEPTFHEEIADYLADNLPGDQTISATHSGVEVITKR